MLRWQRDGSDIPADGIEYEITEFSRRLKILNPSPRHSGNYTCYVGELSDPFRKAETAVVRVLSTPRIEREPPSEIDLSRRGPGAQIDCPYEAGSPPGTIEW